MSFIVTASGDELSIAHPRPEHITALSIAWSLAQINRFNGHALRPYSVAEHSLLVCDIAERELGLDVHGQLAALMHDAHESVATDMHTPGKRAIGTYWYSWEYRWQRLVQSCFAIIIPSQVHEEAIKRADLMALATERRDLVHPAATTPWPALHGVEPLPWVDLNARERKAMGWEDWRDRWLDKYHELDFARNERHFHLVPSGSQP